LKSFYRLAFTHFETQLKPGGRCPPYKRSEWSLFYLLAAKKMGFAKSAHSLKTLAQIL
jgi:hypothetical protein